MFSFIRDDHMTFQIKSSSFLILFDQPILGHVVQYLFTLDFLVKSSFIFVLFLLHIHICLTQLRAAYFLSISQYYYQLVDEARNVTPKGRRD